VGVLSRLDLKSLTEQIFFPKFPLILTYVISFMSPIRIIFGIWTCLAWYGSLAFLELLKNNFVRQQELKNYIKINLTSCKTLLSKK